MATPRFHCPLPLHAGQRLTLPDAIARHAVGALRLRDGDPIVLFNGDGSEFPGTLLKAGKHAEALLRESRRPQRESPLPVTLVQGISSGERMDFTLQKAVELGVLAIQPVLMRRTVVRLDADKRGRRVQHWQAVAISACEQCGRNIIPEVAPILDFPDWLRRDTPEDTARFLLDPEAGLSARTLSPPSGEIELIVGPEGGFDPAERDAAIAAGCQPLRLGPRILRTETAAMVALAAMQSLWGDL
jgi:16S rRNA (uracil1498-N3)-methyltransferase